MNEDIRARAAALFIHESGPPNAPAVVFLQGSAVSGAMWREHIARLPGFRCLAPDFPGFGRSHAVPWRSFSECADLVAEIIETRVPSKKAHLVGLSLGGGVAHLLLARRPELLGRVLIDSAGGLGWWGNLPFLLGVRALAPFVHTRWVIELISRAVGGLSAPEKADIRIASRRAFARSFIESFQTRIQAEELKAPNPLLLVCGERERPIRTANAALAELMPNATARFVRGVGHGWLGTKPELHLRMVEAWLKGQPLPEELVPETVSWSRARLDRALRHSARKQRAWGALGATG